MKNKLLQLFLIPLMVLAFTSTQVPSVKLSYSKRDAQMISTTTLAPILKSATKAKEIHSGFTGNSIDSVLSQINGNTPPLTVMQTVLSAVSAPRNTNDYVPRHKPRQKTNTSVKASPQTVMQTVLDTFSKPLDTRGMQFIELQEPQSLIEQSFRKDYWVLLGMIIAGAVPSWVGATACLLLSVMPMVRIWKKMKEVLDFNMKSNVHVNNNRYLLMSIIREKGRILTVTIDNATNLNQTMMVFTLRTLSVFAFLLALVSPDIITAGVVLMGLSALIPILVTIILIISQSIEHKNTWKTPKFIHKIYSMPLSNLYHLKEELRNAAKQEEPKQSPPPVNKQNQPPSGYYRIPSVLNIGHWTEQMHSLATQCEALLKLKTNAHLEELITSQVNTMMSGMQSYLLDFMRSTTAFEELDNDTMRKLVLCVFVGQAATNKDVFALNIQAFAATYLYLYQNSRIEFMYNNANSEAGYGADFLETIKNLHSDNNALLCGVIAHENMHRFSHFTLPVLGRKDNNIFAYASIEELMAMLAAKSFVASCGFQPAIMDALYSNNNQTLLYSAYDVALKIISNLESKGYQHKELLNALFSILLSRTDPIGNRNNMNLFNAETLDRELSLLYAA